MSARKDPGGSVETTLPDIAVSSRVPVTRSGAPAGPGRLGRPRRPGQLMVVILAAAAVLAVVAGTAWALQRDDQGVTAPAAAAKPKATPTPAAPAASTALALTVDLPSTVTAGTSAEIVVHYSDALGIFSGTTEDWGDGVGTSSLKQGACGAGAPPARALTGSYTLTHTWEKPGTYTVGLGVGSYTCAGTVATEEQAAKTVSVTVVPR
jgi:hypothetical protein